MDTNDPAAVAPSSPTQDILLRLRQRFGQSELSRRTGIPQPRLSRWEAGDVPVAADDALKLLDFERSLAPDPDAPATPEDQPARAA